MIYAHNSMIYFHTPKSSQQVNQTAPPHEHIETVKMSNSALLSTTSKATEHLHHIRICIQNTQQSKPRKLDKLDVHKPPPHPHIQNTDAAIKAIYKLHV